MNWLDWLAAVAFFLLIPIPVYWLVLHPFAAFWRKVGARGAFVIAVTIAWGAAAAFLYFWGLRMFSTAGVPLWRLVAGLALIAGELLMLRQVVRTLGPDRLVGRAEMAGSGQLMTSGIYARLRHPSYAGMMAAMLGVCLLAGTRSLWVAAGIWLVLMRVMVAFEERELVARFGEPYRQYRARVPAFLPLPFLRRTD